MTAKRVRLTDQLVRKLPLPEGNARIYYDANLKGFGCRVTPGGAKSFCYVYRSPIDGRARTFTIGQFQAGHGNPWPAAKARKLVQKFRREHADPAGDQDAKRQAIEAERRAETINQLCDLYIEEHLPEKRPRSRREDMIMIDGKVRPALGTVKIKDLTRQDVKRFHRRITEGRMPGQRSRAPYGANRALALLRKMLSLAVEHNLRPDNPAKGVKPNPEHARATFLDANSIRRLCQAAGEHPNRQSADALMLLLLTGCRRGEVLGAEWSEIDLDTGWWTIPVERKKSKRPHRVKLSEPALAILKERRETTKGPYVFPNPKGDGPQQDLRNFFKTVCDQASLEGLRVHDLRHSVASILFNSGATYAQIGQVLGHSTPQMTMRYSHMFDQTQSELANRVAGAVTTAINGD